MQIIENKVSRWAIAAIGGALLALGATGCTHPDMKQSLRSTAAQQPQGGPMLLAVYQPWFGNGEHLNVGYSAMDRVVVGKQIEQAKNMGIAGFVVNWYGPKKDFEDRSTALLADLASSRDFKVALQYDEPADEGDTTDAVLSDLQYAYDRFIGPQAGSARNAYLQYQGRPLLFIFPKSNKTNWKRVRQAVSTWESPPLLIYKDENPEYGDSLDGFYAWVQPGKEGWQRDGSNWGRQYLEAFYSRMSAGADGKIVVGSAWPGFDDSNASWGRNRKMGSRCGKTFEDSLRMFRRYYNERNPLPFLLIETWNDYEEGTAIEKGLSKCG